MITVVVTRLHIGDCEDPDIYIAPVAYQFLHETERGQWLSEQGLTCGYQIVNSPNSWGYEGVLYADMTEQQRVEWVLRYADHARSP